MVWLSQKLLNWQKWWNKMLLTKKCPCKIFAIKIRITITRIKNKRDRKLKRLREGFSHLKLYFQFVWTMEKWAGLIFNHCWFNQKIQKRYFGKNWSCEKWIQNRVKIKDQRGINGDSKIKRNKKYLRICLINLERL